MLVKVKGMLLVDNDDVDVFDFICIIVIVCIMMFIFYVCFFVGCEQMNEQIQVMCFMVGVNLIFYGCKLLIMLNLEEDKDLQLFCKLGINLQQMVVLEGDNEQQQCLEQVLFILDIEEYYNVVVL